MNDFLRGDIRKELEMLLSLDTDSELFKYQYKNEKKIGKFLGKGYSRGTSCGTAALQFSLNGLGIGKGDEVITSSSYISTLLSISDTGAKPVLVDILPDTMLMDTDKIYGAITEKTKAILPIHLYGQMCNMDKIMKIAKKNKIAVVEDACQAHLARFNGKLPGSISDSACYSLFLNKNFGGISNGGMIITKHKKLHKNIEILRNPDCDDPLILESGRTPAFLDWIQIAFLKSKMRYMKKWTERRREIANRYYEELSGLQITLPVEDKKAYHVYRDFAIRVKNRDKLKRKLKRKNIETIIHYPEAYHLTKTYEHLGYRKGFLPIIEESYSKVLSLPIHPFLTEEEIHYVIKSVKKSCK